MACEYVKAQEYRGFSGIQAVNHSKSFTASNAAPVLESAFTFAEKLFTGTPVKIVESDSDAVSQALDHRLHFAISSNQQINLLKRMNHGRVMFTTKLPCDLRVALTR